MLWPIGQVLVDGQTMNADRHHRLHAGGTRSLPEDEDADQPVYFRALLHCRSDAAEARRYGLGAAERSSSTGKPTDTLESLSLGNQQWVQIAAVFIHRPSA